MADSRRIVYVGFRSQHRDCTYGTGYWEKGQTKLVEAGVAARMLRHQDVYREGEEVDNAHDEAVTEWPENAREHESENTMNVLYAINTMDTEALCQFVAHNFQQKLDRRKSVENLRIDAANMVHQFGVD